MGKGRGATRQCRELNQLWPYKDIFCVRRWSNARPAGRVGIVKYSGESSKQGSKRFNSITKTIHFVHPGILFIYVLYCIHTTQYTKGRLIFELGQKIDKSIFFYILSGFISHFQGRLIFLLNLIREELNL